MVDDNDPFSNERPTPETVWHCYHIAPIDHAWEFLPKVEDFANKLALNEDPEAWGANTFLHDLERAKELASRHGWEGDFTVEPRVFFLPGSNDCAFTYAFAWQQSNNGSTFIVSPFELTWLGDSALFSGTSGSVQ